MLVFCTLWVIIIAHSLEPETAIHFDPNIGPHLSYPRFDLQNLILQVPYHSGVLPRVLLQRRLLGVPNTVLERKPVG
ncbi:hypothetical protein BDV12DRAFT_177683 [Aspergillus spectabilis]